MLAGGDTRLGFGYDSKDKLRGEIMQVLAGDDRTVWLGEAWVGKQAGGLKLDYHWSAETDDQVRKIFAAWDRNRWNDQKLTVGAGGEGAAWFWGGYGSLGLTGRRDSGTSVNSVTETIHGSDPNLGDFLRDVTTTTTIRSFERAYDYGVGGRLGRYYEASLIRLGAGLDYEWGRSASAQTTFSLTLEKFFAGSPHSILLAAAISDRRGDFEMSRHDHRVGIYWRYQFGGKNGGVWQPAFSSQRVAEPVASTTAGVDDRVVVPAKSDSGVQQRTVQVIETVSAETFFDLNRTTLRPEALRVLNQLAAKLKEEEIDGRLTITGHTCDLGSSAYNQRLSERRAGAVRDYLVATGVLAADRIEVVGKGEDDPKYPNTRAERYKNRRCEIEFGVVERHIEDLPVESASMATVPPGLSKPPVEPQRHDEQTPAASAWLQRALRNPVAHKREVDTYRQQEKSITVEEGVPHFLNKPPVAVDDRAWWYGRNMPAIIDVLGNDHDPDGDRLRVIAVTNGQNGDVSIQPDGTLKYMWRQNREGYDYFTYTISDGKGGVATARVTLVVIDP